MRIIEKNSNNVKVKIEIDDYEENFNFKLTWENEVDLEEDNVLNKYNPTKVLAVEAKEFK